MKTCASCAESKPLDEFYRLTRSKDGRQGYCKPCANRKRNEWGKAHPERNAEWNRNSYLRLTPERRHKERLVSHFRMSTDQYNALLESQGGACPGCGRSNVKFHVDHDHACCNTRYTCGKCVRGLLCFNCNVALGNVRDNQETLMNLIKYLGTPGQCDPVFGK